MRQSDTRWGGVSERHQLAGYSERLVAEIPETDTHSRLLCQILARARSEVEGSSLRQREPLNRVLDLFGKSIMSLTSDAMTIIPLYYLVLRLGGYAFAISS